MAIIEVIAHHPEGLPALQIQHELGSAGSLRTLQYRLKHLTERGGVTREGQARAARYRIEDEIGTASLFSQEDRPALAISKAGASILKNVTQPLARRRTVGYERTFLDSHRPNERFYFTEQERAQLHEISRPQVAGPPGSIYTSQMLERLLVDLSWNSCRLEGSTYSLAESRRLIHFCQAAEGKNPLETQMILNHRDAIEFLATSASTIGFNRYTILNLQAMLCDNLQADASSSGRLRQAICKIEGTSFRPPGGIPQIIEECFDQILSMAEMIRDPFEQAFFAMVQLSYLHPFETANRPVSRLSANIPLIKAGLSPLSFVEVPRDLYLQALLGIYELNQVDLLKDIFIWACKRSAARSSAARQPHTEPDPLKLRYHESLHDIVHTIVRTAMGRMDAGTYISERTSRNLPIDEHEAFRECVETELLNLHKGNFARYRILPEEFRAWQEAWTARAPARA